MSLVQAQYDRALYFREKIEELEQQVANLVSLSLQSFRYKGTAALKGTSKQK